MKRLFDRRMSAHVAALDSYWDRLVLAEANAPVPMPIGSDLTTTVYQVHSAAIADRVEPPFADSLLQTLLAAQKDQTNMRVQPGGAALVPPSQSLPWIEVVERPWLRLNWAALVGLALIGVILAGIWWPILNRNDSPILIAPTEPATPDASPTQAPDFSGTPVAPGVTKMWEVSIGDRFEEENGINQAYGEITIAPDGTIWIPDYRHNTIRIFSADGEFLEAWGTSGSGDGQFSFLPAGALGSWASADVVFDADGNIYVVDTGNNRVQKFGPDRSFLRSFGSTGAEDDPARLYAPRVIEIDSSGTLYVVENRPQRMQASMYSAEGEYLGQFRTNRYQSGFVGGGELFAIDPSNDTVWVANSTAMQIGRYGLDGVPQRFFGEQGGQPGQLRMMQAIATGPNGTLFAGDFESSRIQAFTRDGNYLVSWIPGPEPDQGDFISGIAVAPDGSVYVVDGVNAIVRKFAVTLPETPPMGDLIPGLITDEQPSAEMNVNVRWQAAMDLMTEMHGPVSAAMNDAGETWIIDAGSDLIRIVSSDGSTVELFGAAGSGPGEFRFTSATTAIAQVVFLDDGSAWVLDPGNERIQHFAADRTFLGELTVADFGGELVDLNLRLYRLAENTFGVVDLTDEDPATSDMLVLDAGGSVLRTETYQGAYPLGILADGSYWTVLAAGDGTGTIAQFNADGAMLSSAADGMGGHISLRLPLSGAVDAEGRLYLADPYGQRVSVHGDFGREALWWNGGFEQTGTPFAPAWVAIGPDGSVLVIDSSQPPNVVLYDITW